MSINIQTKYKETEIGTVPEEWEVLELKKITEPIKNAYLPNSEENLNYIGLEHIDQQTLSLNSVGTSSDVTSTKFKFEAGDILFGKLRPYFRKVYRPKFSGISSTDIWVMRAKENIDQGWLFYLLANEDFIKAASGGSGGTRMPRADWHHLKNTVWPVPEIIEQKQIAEILSSLDDKIELNRKINANLEKLASSLFKKWVVDIGDELPEGWRIGKFGDIAEITSGKRPRNNQDIRTDDFGIPLLGASSVMGYVKEYLYNEPILITGRVGTHGVIQKIDYPCWPSDNTFVIKSKFLEFTYHIMKSFDFASLNRGSTQPLITQSDLKNIEIRIPEKTVLEKFEAIVTPFAGLVRDNEKESQNLSKVRDSLLSRLMTGKIRVNI